VNPRVPSFLRAVTWFECLVVASAAAMLLTTPKRGGQDIWAWITPPFNARYVGVIYLGALIPLLVFAVHGRWNPGRLVLWEIFTFTAAIMVVMLAYAGRFEWARVATWVFWPLYVFLPVNSAVFLWRLRDWRVPEPRLHARSYAATYLTPAVGAWVLRGGDPRRPHQHRLPPRQPRAHPRGRRAAQRKTRECSGRHASVTGSPISQRSWACETCVFCSSATTRVPAASSTITCVVVPT
jgi:hypothetical protein